MPLQRAKGTAENTLKIKGKRVCIGVKEWVDSFKGEIL